MDRVGLGDCEGLPSCGASMRGSTWRHVRLDRDVHTNAPPGPSLFARCHMSNYPKWHLWVVLAGARACSLTNVSTTVYSMVYFSHDIHHHGITSKKTQTFFSGVLAKWHACNTISFTRKWCLYGMRFSPLYITTSLIPMLPWYCCFCRMKIFRLPPGFYFILASMWRA